ncbi:MAG: phospho-sugar mutase [Planctomycetaceae bacterium]
MIVSEIAEISQIEAAVSEGQLSASAGKNVARWLSEPPYQAFAEPIRDLIEAEDWDQLDRLFWEVIPFGTGGRRGLMADFGSATINSRTIAESADGLAKYVHRETGKAGAAVVAHDTRHHSREFARLTATTLAANGMKVFLFESYRSTPELSFAVRHLACDAGVMITASHNPPSDNGFKAYWSTGGQVLPPHDKGIIDCVYEAGDIPTVDFDAAVAEGRIELIGEEVDEAFLQAVVAMSLSEARDLPGLYSPLHGVGETVCYEVLQRAGFEGIAIYEPHRDPDGDFPNVADHFPNPERTAVYETLIAAAKENGQEIVLASDPDADRLGVCVKGPDGEFVHLNGNQIGALLVDYILRKRTSREDLTPQHFVVETLVTTPLIGDIARSHGLRVIDDLLVGFKYIAETIDAEGPDNFLFGAEESIGYLAGTYARDKDAGIAALYVAECAAELRAGGKTLLDRLDELYVQYGYYLERQLSKVCEGSEGRRQTLKLMNAFRRQPPSELAGLALESVHDFGLHEYRTLPTNAKLAGLQKPDGNLLIFQSAPTGGCTIRIAVRPSGTEPKIKFYLFARSDCGTAEALEDVKATTAATLEGIRSALSKWIDATLRSE